MADGISTGPEICVLCPTRGRPGDFEALVESFLKTSTHAHLMAYVDADDDSLYPPQKSDRVTVTRGPRLGLAGSVNAMASGFGAYGLATDDSAFLTPGWDDYARSVIGSFPGGIGVLSPSHPSGRFVNFPYVSDRWVRALGWFACPEMRHYAWDTVCEVLGVITNIVYAKSGDFSVSNSGGTPGEQSLMLENDAKAFSRWCGDIQIYGERLKNADSNKQAQS